MRKKTKKDNRSSNKAKDLHKSILNLLLNVSAIDSEDEEEVPLPSSKFAAAGDSVFFNRKELERRGINIDKDLNGENEDAGDEGEDCGEK